MIVKIGDERFPDTKAFIWYAKNNKVIAEDNRVGTNKLLVAGGLNTKMEGLRRNDTYSAILGGHVDCG